MKRGFYSGFLRYPLYILLLISLQSITALAEPTLTLVTGDITVGLYHTPEKTGLVDEVLEVALQRIGYEFDVRIVPTERSLKMAELGIADGELLRTRAIENNFPSLLRVPEPLVESEFVVFSREPVDLMEGWGALAGKSVGVVIGMKIIENNVPENALVAKVVGEEQLFSMLQKQRIDYAVFVRGLGEYYLNNKDIRGFVINEIVLEKVPAYIYLHPKHAALVPRLTKALKDMKQDGEFEKIVERYWRVSTDHRTVPVTNHVLK